METSDAAPSDVGDQPSALQLWIRDRVYVLSADATASHEPTGSGTYNSQGGKNYIERTGVGRYIVHSQWMNDGAGTVQVVAYGSDPVRCKVASWNTSSSRYAGNLAVNVRCHGTNGSLTDSRFAMHFLGEPWGADDGDAAYLWTSTTDSQTVENPYSFNGGGDIELTRLSAGTYVIIFDGLTTGARYGNLQVTAYGTGPEYCVVNNHGLVDHTGTANDVPWAAVNCWNNGVRVDSRFTLLLLTDYVTDSSVEHAYLYADDDENDSYTPDTRYQLNTVSGVDSLAGRSREWDPVRGAYTSDGSYFFQPDALTVRLPLVTARANDGTYCKVRLRRTDEVVVYCFEPSGRRANSRYYGVVLDR